MRDSNRAVDRTTWEVGQRVSRKSTGELGMVVEINDSIKVKWDGGSVSFFDYSTPGDVE